MSTHRANVTTPEHDRTVDTQAGVALDLDQSLDHEPLDMDTQVHKSLSGAWSRMCTTFGPDTERLSDSWTRTFGCILGRDLRPWFLQQHRVLIVTATNFLTILIDHLHSFLS